MQEIVFLDYIKAIFLCIILPNSWEMFCATSNNFVVLHVLTSANVEDSILIEKINWKSIHKGKVEALLVHARDRIITIRRESNHKVAKNLVILMTRSLWKT